MQFLIFEEEKFYALCTLKDKNFAPKQNERDCPMTFEYFFALPFGTFFVILISKTRSTSPVAEDNERNKRIEKRTPKNISTTHDKSLVAGQNLRQGFCASKRKNKTKP